MALCLLLLVRWSILYVPFSKKAHPLCSRILRPAPRVELHVLGLTSEKAILSIVGNDNNDRIQQSQTEK